MNTMENWIRITYVNNTNVTTKDETAARGRLETAIEQAVSDYMRESRVQDIASIEMFPCDADCAA
jgi:hypothetical protein